MRQRQRREGRRAPERLSGDSIHRSRSQENFTLCAMMSLSRLFSWQRSDIVPSADRAIPSWGAAVPAALPLHDLILSSVIQVFALAPPLHMLLSAPPSFAWLFQGAAGAPVPKLY